MAKNTNFLFKLDLLILSILKESDQYGYQLTKIISEQTNNLIVPKAGTMYPVLYDLMDKKYISSYDEYVGTKIRVYYHLEDSGKEYLKKLINDYDTLVKTINSIIHK